MIAATLALQVLLAAQVQPTPLPAGPAPAVPTPLVSAPSAAPTPPATAPITPVPLGTRVMVTTPVPGTAIPDSSSEFAYRFVPKRPDHVAPGAPQIFAVYLNTKVLRSLGPIHIKVLTDPGTVKVTSRSNGREGLIPMISPGDFEALSTLPKVPFIADGMEIQLEFIALGQNGQHLSVHVPVTLR